MRHHMDKQNKILDLSENFLISLMFDLYWTGRKSWNIFTDLTSIIWLVVFLSNIYISLKLEERFSVSEHA